jgi:DNA modification methylase
LNEVILGDCLEKIKDIPDNSIDLIITSPPYDNIENAGYAMKGKDILFLKLYSDFLDKFFNEIYRVLKPTGQFYFNIKSGTSKKTLITPHWIESLESFRQFKFKSYIIWKYSGSFDSTKARFHLDYEIIYHLSKTDDITIYYEDGEHDPLTSVWNIPHNIPKDQRVHPTQYPEALAEKMIKRGSKEGDVVLDPFAGSGTSLVVAKRLGRKYIGIEINPTHYEGIKERLN